MIPSCLFLFVLLPLASSKISCNLDPNDPELQDDDDGGGDYSACNVYRELATELLKDDRNFYNLQNVFFPPIGSSPVFVTVKYHYSNSGDDKLNATSNTTYFWSSAVYFFLHPVRIFQFTSLLLSDPSLRYDEVDLFLPANYSNANSSCMVLLTQRLKLYAAHQFERVEAPIDNTYTASAHSADTVISWYNDSPDVANIAVSTQVLFPVFITVFVFMFFLFVLEIEPYNLSTKLRNELESNDRSIKDKADSGILTKYIAAVLFHLFTLGNDGAALFHYRYVPDVIREYYCSEPNFWAAPIIMIIFDSFTFVLFIFIPPVVALCKKKNYILIYSMISPLSCIASHSYHIVFAFIIDPYHTTSILLLYAIIAFVNIQGFQKPFYFINTLISGGKCSCCHIKNCCGRYATFMGCFIFEFVFMETSISLSIALLIKLPLSNALDDAPNHLYVIYQASVTFFAALIVFQVLFRQTNSSFNVFIEAIDAKKKKANTTQLLDVTGDDTKDWMDLSEKEKEICVAKLIISFLNSDVISPNSDELSVMKENGSPSVTGIPDPQRATPGGSSDGNRGGCFSCSSGRTREIPDPQRATQGGSSDGTESIRRHHYCRCSILTKRDGRKEAKR